MALLLADDVVFHSPVVHTPQVGKAITARYLTAAFHVFFNESFRYVREIVGPHDAALEFASTLAGDAVGQHLHVGVAGDDAIDGVTIVDRDPDQTDRK